MRVEGSAAPETSGGRGRFSSRRDISPRALTGLLAFSMGLSALGIDALLPAFDGLREEFGFAADATEVSRTVTAYFVGLAVGTLFYGPIADRFGRRPTMLLGVGVYLCGAVLSAAASSFSLLLLARLIWGIGAAGPRVVGLAVLRDRFEGDRMTQAMSTVMAIFIVVPVVAPTFGAAVLALGSWRWVCGACAIAALVVLTGSMRLPETLREEHRRRIHLASLADGAGRVLRSKPTVAYLLGTTLLYGAFTGYLGGSEVIFSETFGQEAAFPYLFGGLAATMSLAMLANRRVVDMVGTETLSVRVLVAYVIAAAVFSVAMWATDGRPALWVFLVGMMAMMSCHAMLLPNLNTLAMAPMAEIAGTATSIIGATQIGFGSVLGAIVDARFDGTPRPLVMAFMFAGAGALGCVIYAQRVAAPATAIDT